MSLCELRSLGQDGPTFNFIAPNLDDDMHDAPVATGDTWLGTHLGDILSSSSYKAGGLVIIVWDEDDSSGGYFPPYSDDPIGLWVISPYAKSGGYVSTTTANHYSLLATIEDGLALERLGNAAKASPLSDFFPAK